MNEEQPTQAYGESLWVKEHLRPFLSWLLPRHAALGGKTELRLLRKTKGKGTWSGFFGPEDVDTIVGLLTPVPGGRRDRIPRGGHPRVGEANVYFSMQPVSIEVTEGRCGTLTRARTTARDKDIVATTLFVVDIDPEREPKNVSATKEEKAAAREVAESVRAWLRERGVEPIWADSGNGFHLLVPLVATKDVRGAAQGARALLRHLDGLFSNERAKVDTSTFNPSRILKLYGTQAIKGDATAERPHRFATVELGVVPDDVDLLSLIDGDLPKAKPKTRRPRPRTQRRRQSRPSANDSVWSMWRKHALDALPLETVYGELLTGTHSGQGWLQCRDPDSPSGDKNPSAGVADGTGEAERAAFHSFRDGETISVFDFLVRTGRAADFKAACVLISEWSGVEMPNGGQPPTAPSDVVHRLVTRWPGIDDEDQRVALLHGCIAELLDLPAAKREPYLEQIRAATGLGSRVFRESVSEARKAAKERAKPAVEPTREVGRAVVEYVQNRETVAGLFDAILEAVKPATRFFRTERDVVFVRRGVGPIVVTDRNLGGLLSALVEIRFVRETEDGASFQRFGVLPAELARAFVSDPRVWSCLPKLRLYCRSPLFDERWGFVGRSGYHPGPGVFYDGPTVKPTNEGTPLLHKALADFHWKAEPDLVNFVGVLLTALTMPHWSRGHPFLAVNGNKPGVGKTTLARVLGVLVEGAEPNTVSFIPDDTEFEKQLATRVEAGDRVIVIDNAKTTRAIQSAVLERCITDSRLSFRRLGSNSAITRPQNDILFCLTMNLTHLGQDLRRRALPVNLVLNADVRQTTYALADVVGFVVEHRLAIVAELAGMVQLWLDAGRPGCENPAKHSTSQVWASTLDAILRLSGFDGFLTNFDESAHAFDPKYELMLDVVGAHKGKGPASAAQWVTWLEELLVDRFKDRRGQPKSARAKSTIVGNLFRDYLDTRFVVLGAAWRLVRSYPEGEGRKPAYALAKVDS